MSTLTLITLLTVSPMQDQTNQRVDVKVTREVRFVLSLPEDYDSKAKWPLLLFLHGAGERGSDLELVKKHGPTEAYCRGDKTRLHYGVSAMPDTGLVGAGRTGGTSGCSGGEIQSRS